MSFSGLTSYIPDIIDGLIMSIIITLLGMLFGSLLGLLAAVAKNSENFLLSKISSTYIEVIRNTPLLIQLYLLYFGLGQLGIQLEAFWVAFIGLTLNNGAYVAEIFRAGFKVVHKGLIEAGLALGFDKSQVFRYVVFTPALKSIFPALTNQFILLFLFSSITSTIAYEDLTYQIMNINSQTALTFEIFIVGTIIYYVASLILTQVLKFAEKKAFKW